MAISHKPKLEDAIQALVPGASFIYNGSYKTLYWAPNNSHEKPAEQELLEKLAFLEESILWYYLEMSEITNLRTWIG